MWPEKPGGILEKIGKIKWSPTMSDDDSKRNVEDFNRLFREFITWAVEDAIENKDNPEAMKFHGFLLAKLTELRKSLEAKASLSYLFSYSYLLTSSRLKTTNKAIHHHTV